ncbi:hypothetical protein CSKR_109130 [Clonorchis sinensis]|uniref:Uncharacterized protein n=1 Tax=Clonorchis sinensis TaxID=79923 RepID=A0A3R7DJS9_CLOSI|nr:hypothetical protein CSKR_109130 [Clonorchis sinensis]
MHAHAYLYDVCFPLAIDRPFLLLPCSSPQIPQAVQLDRSGPKTPGHPNLCLTGEKCLTVDHLWIIYSLTFLFLFTKGSITARGFLSLFNGNDAHPIPTLAGVIRRDGPSVVTPFRCLAAMSPKGSTRAGILPGCPSLDRGSRETEAALTTEPSRPQVIGQYSGFCTSGTTRQRELFHSTTVRRVDTQLARVAKMWTYRMVRGLNPTTTIRPLLSRLLQPGSISTLVLRLSGIATRH